MKIILIISTLSIIFSTSYSQELLTPYEKDNLSTATYNECISFYKELAKQYDKVNVVECGLTDVGRPLHLVIVSKDKIFDPAEIRKSGKIVLMINNGIHPGEPDGIDACMMFIRSLVKSSGNRPLRGLDYDTLLNHVVVIAIPVYNIDGALNRNDYFRVNQLGPKEYGFRANAENRDLNRDFIKCDTRNTRSFIEIFQKWKPELFVDTHTTDGDDYQYKMTYIATLPAKLETVLADYLTGRMIPFLETDMKNKNMEMCPYVETYKSTPDSGIVGYFESPRYSTGYAALFNTIGFVSESHMLKTYTERVEASYGVLESLLKVAATDWAVIKSNKEKADFSTITRHQYDVSWKLDESSPSKYFFKGYTAKYKKSTLTGLDRLYFDKNQPWEKEIDYYNKYIPVSRVVKPLAYIVPQAWWQVIELLKLNGVEMTQLEKDRSMSVETYYIEKCETSNRSFEGHYFHSNVDISVTRQQWQCYKGDYIISTNQAADNFIVNVLEPQSTDSYFNWNFFDGILQQKEYFDPYLFEDIADSLLNTKPGLRDVFEGKKKSDKEFRENSLSQLEFIYDNTIREPEFMRYPVGRIIGE